MGRKRSDSKKIDLEEIRRSEILAMIQSRLSEKEVEEIKQKPPEEQEKIVNTLADDYLNAIEIAKGHSILRELTVRSSESLRIYEPLSEQMRFHKSKAQLRVLRGSNRGGKTLPAAVEVARAVTGQDPYNKYPKENGRFFLVGKDLSHIGQVMWRKLAEYGPFKMIRDLETGKFRSYRPWDYQDQQREMITKAAPPLIPQRFIKEIAWESKKEGIPALVKFTTGWEIHFYSSLGKPPNGVDIDGFWFDEEIIDQAWYPEMVARIVDRSGRGIWSATPQAGTEQLYELHERCAVEFTTLEEDQRKAEEFVILIKDNPHIHEEDKEDLEKNLATDDEIRVRIGGEFLITSYKMYPEFHINHHGMDIDVIPSAWTRYAYIDPAYATCAVLFVAVPEDRKFLLAYDELYLKQCDAFKFSMAMREKCQGYDFEAFIIDYRGSIRSDVGVGKTILQQYTDALAKVAVKSRRTGSGFLPSSSDVEAGIMAFRSLLRIREDGTPMFRIRKGHLPNFEWEIKRYHRKRGPKGIILDQPDQKKDNHLMDAVRYMAMHDPKYHAPPIGGRMGGYAVKAVRDKKTRKRQKEGGAKIRFG